MTKSEGERTALAGYTRNISGGGVLFTAEPQPPPGGRIEYVITLPSAAAHPVNVRCIGRVLRSEPDGVAATLERFEFLRTG